MSRRPQHLLPRLQQWQLPALLRPRLRPVRQPQHLLQLRHLRLPLRQHPHQRRLHARGDAHLHRGRARRRRPARRGGWAIGVNRRYLRATATRGR